MAKKGFLSEGEEFSLPQLEEKVLAFWREHEVFEKSLAKNQGVGGKTDSSKTFVFYEGPPYANGKPAMHHVLARVVKDVVLRYKTMRGYYVPRRAGWDTHGLPVEMAAEKALGFKTKRDIEEYGVEKFNEKAKEQVWIHKDEWERLTNRIGYWLDLKNAYVTYAPEYIEAIWGTLAKIWERKIDGERLLYKGHKVVPWCTRCGTALSSHELAQGYKEVSNRSVYVKFKLKPGQKIGRDFVVNDNTYILSWTTTPWTLPGNVALAVGEDIEYNIQDMIDENGQRPNEHWIVSVAMQGSVLGNPHSVNRPIRGKDLLGLEYEPLFEVAPLQKPEAYKIYAADFVTTTDGTGVVHTAVMYGEDDYELGKKVGLPQHHTVSEEGKFLKDVPALVGEYVKSKETEEKIFEHLRTHGNLLRIEDYKHEYPFCWRCGTALIYYARTSWFIAMSRLRTELQERNQTIHWMPEHVRDGRFGEWLKEAKDWNLSRERYWGAPLPIWECAKCGRTEVIDSLEKLSQCAGGGKNHYIAIRHGDSENVAFDIIDSGNQKFHLTADGRHEVENAAEKLAKGNIDLIFASDLMRTKETAEIIGERLGKKIHYDQRLREINLGSLSGMQGNVYGERIPTQEARFTERAAPDAETLREVRARVWHFLRDMEREHQGKHILIVSHEDTIWMLDAVARGLSEKKTAEEKSLHGGAFMDPAHSIEFDVASIPRDDTGDVDLHRPFVDEITFACGEKKCDGTMRRVREVADVWYDSGAMPYASGAAFPADYIAEGMDQTRGWFYTLLAIATALGYEAPYRNVITFGLMNDKFGNKMSKSKGNVIEPFEIIDKYGVDAVRWYFFAGTPFGEPKNFDENEVGKKLRQVHLIVYNSFLFWKTYAKKGIGDRGWEVRKAENVLDRWVLARLDELIASVTTKLDMYQIREAAFDIESFVDDLSRWYIRRSRRRLQKPDASEAGVRDYEAASATLGFVLRELVKLMAPFTPFFAEGLYEAVGGGKESVHLEEWPKAAGGNTQDLVARMQRVRELAALGLALRAGEKIKVRQPLLSFTVKDETLKNQHELLAILKDEINVKDVLFDADLDAESKLNTTITPELRDEGVVREAARMIQELRQNAGLEPKDMIALMIEAPDVVRNAIIKYEAVLKTDVGAREIEYKKSEKFDAEVTGKIGEQDIWIALRKIA